MCLLGLRDGASAVRALAVLAEHLDSVPSPNWQLKLSVTLVPEALMASSGRHRHSVHVVHRLHADKNFQKRKGKFKVFVGVGVACLCIRVWGLCLCACGGRKQTSAVCHSLPVPLRQGLTQTWSLCFLG